MAGSPERSRELSFLLGCCAPNPARASLELPGVDFDWSWLEAAARWHGVIPLVARQLARLDGSSNPIRQRIMTHATANALRNQYLASRLIDLMREFSQSAIAALAIKGPMLAQIAYGDAGLRMFADLDVLVHQADVPRAARLLGELGFSPDNYDEAAFRSDFFHTVEVNFRARDGDVNLDLHWDLSPGYYPFGPPGDALWDRATVATFCATPVLTLAPEDHLLYLVVHASRHGWPVLSQICDIAHLASRVKLDWATLRDRAAASGCARMLNLGVILATDLVAAELPTELIAEARADAGLAATRLRALFTSAALPADSPIRSFARSLVGVGSVGGRLRYMFLRGLAPTLIDWRYCRLPRWLYPAYYLVRPARIVSSLTRSLWSASKDSSAGEPRREIRKL